MDARLIVSKGKLPVCSLRAGVAVRLKHDSQTPARHDRRVGYGEVGTDDLQIARQLKPRCDVEVVEDLKLVLGAQPQATKDKQVDIVLDHLAQVRERVSDAELIVHSSGKETVAAQPNVEESRDWAGRGVCECDLTEDPPTVVL